MQDKGKLDKLIEQINGTIMDMLTSVALPGLGLRLGSRRTQTTQA